LLFAIMLGGCATSVRNDPINIPLLASATEVISPGKDVEPHYEDALIGLSFSGGGTRAAAFSYGVLSAFEEIQLPHVKKSADATALIDRIDFVSGVSGGSIIAAYYALKKRAALRDFREHFLLRDAEEAIDTDLNLLSLARGLAGGVNDSTRFPRWLDQNLFQGATFGQLQTGRRPSLWINASDIYNRTAFIFGRTTFGALCSDLKSYPLANAVAASAAVPVVFAPVVIQTYPGQCNVPLPEWLERVRNDPDESPVLRSFADAIARYRNGEMKYVKLLDGGLVDNYGLIGFTLARLTSKTPYGPLTPKEAVKLRRALFLVVDAGRAPGGKWVETVEGPAGPELVMAAVDTTVGASSAGSFTAFETITDDWADNLVRWRCRLSATERQRYGTGPGWNCRDVKIFVGRISFEQLGPERAAALGAAPTRFKLPPQMVDALIAGGRDALKASPVFQKFLRSMESPSVRIAAPKPAPAERRVAESSQ
jgi:NTE family protein